MRRILALAACILFACSPVPVVPPSPTAVVVTATIKTVTPIPVVTLTITAAPSVTVQPTPDVPVRSFHPMPRAVESINVLQAVCASRATTWNVYDWGMVASFDEVGEQACLAAGRIA